MARKKTVQPMEPAKAAEMRFVRLQLPLEDQRALRLLAAEKDSSMAVLARTIIQEYLATHNPKEGK
jgi:hypothetical protein